MVGGDRRGDPAADAGVLRSRDGRGGVWDVVAGDGERGAAAAAGRVLDRAGRWRFDSGVSDQAALGAAATHGRELSGGAFAGDDGARPGGAGLPASGRGAAADGEAGVLDASGRERSRRRAAHAGAAVGGLFERRAAGGRRRRADGAGAARRRLRVFVSKHFFRNKYDYRVEWLRFVATLSAARNDDVRRTCIQAIAQIFESPGGVLYGPDESGRSFVPIAAWPMRLEDVPVLAPVAVSQRRAPAAVPASWPA